MAPKTGGSLSCNHSFPLRFLSPRVNVLRGGRGFRANDGSGPVKIAASRRAGNCVMGRRERANAVRSQVRKNA